MILVLVLVNQNNTGVSTRNLDLSAQELLYLPRSCCLGTGLQHTCTH